MVRTCSVCGQKNRVPAKHLADTGRCGACKSPLSPMNEPLEVDPEQFDEITRLCKTFGVGIVAAEKHPLGADTIDELRYIVFGIRRHVDVVAEHRARTT